MQSFYTGPGETVLTDHEVLRAVRIPHEAAKRAGAFVKLRLWEGDFAVASVAITAGMDQTSTMRDARLIFGGLAPTPWRATQSEHRLDGPLPSLSEFRATLNCELDDAAHPLPRNGWKLNAAAGLAEQAFAAVFGEHGALRAAPGKAGA